MKDVIWKPIPDFLGYEISQCGQVRSFHENCDSRRWHLSSTPMRILQPRIDSKGYRCISLRRNGKTYQRRISNLVALTFIGPKPHGVEVCHNDGDASNDHLDNLRYDTHKANIEDALKHGTMKRSGEHNPHAKFTNAQAKSIRLEYASSNTTQEKLAGKYGVNRATIGGIVTGKRYRSAGGPVIASNRKLTKADIESIRKQRTDGDSLERIATRYGLSKSCVSLIARGKRH